MVDEVRKKKKEENKEKLRKISMEMSVCLSSLLGD